MVDVSVDGGLESCLIGKARVGACINGTERSICRGGGGFKGASRRLKDVGIDVKIRVIEWASFVNQFIKTSDFDAVILGWSLSLDPDQYNIWHSSQQKPGQFNFIGYSNKEVDQLLEEGRTELNPDKREKIYHAFSKILLRESPIVYLYAGYGLTAMSKRIKGVESPTPPAGIAYNSYEWFIPSTLRRNEITP